MSKLSEAIDKAKREGQMGRNGVDELAPSPAVAAVESPAVVHLTRQRASRPFSPARESSREPTERPDAHGAPEEHMVSLVSPQSLAAEQFRTLRHLVEQCHRDAGLRVLAVTSAGEGEGKSLVAVNLAGALAQNRDARVLLVDCDLRAPSIHTLVGLRGPARGVSELVESPSLDLQDVLTVRSSYNFSVLQAGKPPASPYETLKSARLANAIAEARSTFDYVIIDAPPILIFPDTRILDDQVDAFLLVVGANKTPRKSVEEAAKMFSEDKLLGLVFNGEPHSKKYRYSGSYGRRSSPPRWWRK